MDESKILSGYKLVALGATKLDATLPSSGQKDITPNGSWLEQKQIQSALEARKQLIEVERIEKSGVLSHAEWQEELMLAEVVQKVGGYWQFLGHNVDKHLYLRPEEALFLMEVNCLKLSNGNVIVSLQEAYSLLLRDTISRLQYQVYASLSRIGYKVYRHVPPKATKITEVVNEIIAENTAEKIYGSEASQTNAMEICENSNNIDIQDENLSSHVENGSSIDSEMVNDNSHENNVNNANTSEIPSQTTSLEISKACNSDESPTDIALTKLLMRKTKDCNKELMQLYFENVPDLYQKKLVGVKTPDKKHIPETIELPNKIYTVNLENVKVKNSETSSNNSRTYSMSEEVNGAHIRRVQNYPGSSRQNSLTWVQQSFSNRFPPFSHFRQPRFTNFWRPQNNFYQFMFYQRPFLGNFHFANRIPFFPPPTFSQLPSLVNFNQNLTYTNMTNNARKRQFENSKRSTHLGSIKRIAVRLKNPRNINMQNVQLLRKLIQTFNTRYKSKIRLTDDFNIVDDTPVVETIELEDDEDEQRSKKPRSGDYDGHYHDNLNNIKQFALKLKDLESKGKSNSKYKRAFSKVIKTFNESYNADVYVNVDYEVIDRGLITLDSTSDSDCVIEEQPNSTPGKLLRNPFNILNRLSRAHKPGEASTSTNNIIIGPPPVNNVDDRSYTDQIKNTFSKEWLPHENDFGRAEVLPTKYTKGINNAINEQYLYQFMKTNPYKHESWLSAKISFWKTLKKSSSVLEQSATSDQICEINSIVKPGDCTDMRTILKKLSIFNNIEKRDENDGESSLAIDFDVYNRNIKNFRKSSKPLPHFRVACLDEHSNFPSAAAVESMKSKYNDNVTVIFAIVGTGSVQYLQINRLDLPVYIPSDVT